jgi:hypothetical protein
LAYNVKSAHQAMLFAHLKRIIGLRRLRLRGPTGAKDEFLLAATAQTFASSTRSFRACRNGLDRRPQPADRNSVSRGRHAISQFAAAGLCR